MKDKLKKLFAYYAPYRKLFYSDMFFAILGAAVTLVIPLIVRHITNTVVYYEPERAKQAVITLGMALLLLIVLEVFCNFYIAYQPPSSPP